MYADVGIRCPAAVKALLIASGIDVSFAVAMRVKCSSWSVESTSAMLKSIPNCFAFSCAALEAIWAASRESWGTERVAMMVFVVLFFVLSEGFVMFLAVEVSYVGAAIEDEQV